MSYEMQQAWVGTHVTPNVLWVCVREIRKALGAAVLLPRGIQAENGRIAGIGKLRAIPKHPEANL